MDVNETIVKTLEHINVDHVFGGSGQVNASMLLALRDSKKIKTIIVRNEQAASFMACGYSMFSDRLGVCFATGGPGAFNLFSGMAVAYSDSLPILGITGYTSMSQRGKGALNEATGLSRTPDAHGMFCATTKKSYILEKPNEACDILEDALNTAYNGRPGPVHISIPKDVTVMKVDNFREINLKIKPVLPAEKSVKEFVSVLAEAAKSGKKILLLIGYGCIRSHAEKLLLDFVNRFQIPFVTTMDAKGVLPENHPLSLGVYGSSGDPGANSYFDNCDVVLAIANSFAQNATFGFKPDLYTNKKLLHINIDEHEINKVYKADLAMVSDARPAIDALSKGLSGLLLEVKPLSIKSQKYYDIPLNEKHDKIHPADMVRALSRNLPENAIVMGDAGSHMLWLNCYLRLDKNQRYQNPGSFGPMASHTNGSIGVKCANPDKVVISGSGDGCFLMAGFELLTCVENNIPVIWVIFHNGEFNVIKKFLLNMYNEHAFMQFRNPDFMMYAKACGADGYHVEKLEDFEPALQKAIAANRPALIDVVVDSEVYPPFNLAKV